MQTLTQFSVDHDLRKRRLQTLVNLLKREASTFARQGIHQARAEELSRDEMLEWARQCTNVLPYAGCQAYEQAIENMSDEELLS